VKAAVVDASVSAKWVVAEAHSDAAARLLLWDSLHAPEHWRAEAANALWAKVHRGDLAAKDATERLAILIRAPIVGTRIAALLPSAFAIALDHAVTVHDALYMALAGERGIPFVTADEKLLQHLSRDPKLASLLIGIAEV
jgi:predicted nucleic acid-binding protein